MKRKTWLTLIALAIVVVPIVAVAQGLVPCTGAIGDECQFCRLVQLINNIAAWLVGVLSILAAIMIGYSGFRLVTSGGNQATKEEAKKMISNVFIGFVIILGAWIAINLFMQMLAGGQINGGPWDQIQCAAQPQSVQVINPIVVGSVTLAPQTCNLTAPNAPNSCAALSAQCTQSAGCTASTTQTSATQGTVACSCPAGVSATSTGSCGCLQNGQTINFLTSSVTVEPSLVPRLQAIHAAWLNNGGDNWYQVRSILGPRNCSANAGASNRMSAHGAGLAIDINPPENPHCSPNPRALWDPLGLCGGARNVLVTDMNRVSPPFHTIFTAQGFGWGGNWNSSKDAMHFSAISREGGWMNCP